MSEGIIASRYAKALLKLVDETGNGEVVVRQVQGRVKLWPLRSSSSSISWPGTVA